MLAPDDPDEPLIPPEDPDEPDEPLIPPDDELLPGDAFVPLDDEPLPEELLPDEPLIPLDDDDPDEPESPDESRSVDEPDEPDDPDEPEEPDDDPLRLESDAPSACRPALASRLELLELLDASLGSVIPGFPLVPDVFWSRSAMMLTLQNPCERPP